MVHCSERSFAQNLLQSHGTSGDRASDEAQASGSGKPEKSLASELSEASQKALLRKLFMKGIAAMHFSTLRIPAAAQADQAC